MGKKSTAGVKQELGKLLCLGFEGFSLPKPLRTQLETGEVGGVIIFRRNIQDLRQLKKLCQEIEKASAKASDLPPLIAIDQEWGAVSRFSPDLVTQLPSALAQAATGDPSLIREAARLTGLFLRSLGITWDFAPVLDLGTLARNPSVLTRTFGVNQERVAELALEALAGYREGGVLSCIKHFPGLGDGSVDTHIGSAVIPHGMDLLERRELIPFKKAFAAGAPAVMVTHAAYSGLEAIANWPATFSATVVKELLRTTLAYDGVVIADDLEMGAISNQYSLDEAVFLSITAGNDLVLLCSGQVEIDPIITALEHHLAEGELPIEDVRTAGQRLDRLRQELAGMPPPKEKTETIAKELDDLAEKIAKKAITTVSYAEENFPIPIPSTKRIALFFPERLVNMQMGIGAQPFLQALREDLAFDLFLYAKDGLSPEMETRLQTLGDDTYGILVSHDVHLRDEERNALQMALIHLPAGAVLALGAPYDLRYFPQAGLRLAAYSSDAASQRSAAKVLLGTLKAEGKLPVRV